MGHNKPTGRETGTAAWQTPRRARRRRTPEMPRLSATERLKPIQKRERGAGHPRKEAYGDTKGLNNPLEGGGVEKKLGRKLAAKMGVGGGIGIQQSKGRRGGKRLPTANDRA